MISSVLSVESVHGESVQDESADLNSAPICDGDFGRRGLNSARQEKLETKVVGNISFSCGEDHQFQRYALCCTYSYYIKPRIFH